MNAGLSKVQILCVQFFRVFTHLMPLKIQMLAYYSPFQISDMETEKGYSNYPEPGSGTNYYYMHSTL